MDITIEHKNEGLQEIKTIYTDIDKSNVMLSELAKPNKIVFIEIKHDRLITLLDASDLKNHLLFSFDQNKTFEGLQILNSNDAVFQILSQGRFFLICESNLIKDPEEVKRFRF